MVDKIHQVLFNEANSSYLQQRNVPRYKYLKQREAEFKQIFGKDLGNYLDRHIGFKGSLFRDDFFPEVINIDGVSYNDAIKEQFGERAVELIRELHHSIVVE